jgi:sugar phosphate isomerase/epimerase
MLFTMHGKMDPERWADFFPHVVHVHGKFYGIVDGPDGLTDPSIDWPTVARVLVEQRYTGFISSEYEAHAYSDRYDAFDQVRAQHDMLTGLLEAEASVVAR